MGASGLHKPIKQVTQPLLHSTNTECARDSFHDDLYLRYVPCLTTNILIFIGWAHVDVSASLS